MERACSLAADRQRACIAEAAHIWKSYPRGASAALDMFLGEHDYLYADAIGQATAGLMPAPARQCARSAIDEYFWRQQCWDGVGDGRGNRFGFWGGYPACAVWPCAYKPAGGARARMGQRARQLFMAACADCHTNETQWPWYSSIAPVSWLVARHVQEGRERFNVSEWSGLNEGGEEAAETVMRRSMPT